MVMTTRMRPLTKPDIRSNRLIPVVGMFQTRNREGMLSRLQLVRHPSARNITLQRP